jgi:hypothetical protein
MKGTGWSIILGGVLMAIATLLHPIIVNPWAVLKVLPKTVLTFWMWDHFLMLLGISLWLLSLACVPPVLRKHDPLGMAAIYCFVASFTIWVIVLTMELGVFPPLGVDVLTFHRSDLKSLWSVLFSVGLLSGYGAMFLAYVGIIFLSVNFKNANGLKGFRSWGILCGVIGAVGLLFTLFKIHWGVLLLLLTTPPPFLWTLILGWFLIKEKAQVKPNNTINL